MKKKIYFTLFFYSDWIKRKKENWPLNWWLKWRNGDDDNEKCRFDRRRWTKSSWWWWWWTIMVIGEREKKWIQFWKFSGSFFFIIINIIKLQKFNFWIDQSLLEIREKEKNIANGNEIKPENTSITTTTTHIDIDHNDSSWLISLRWWWNL